jgi:hypothetical protein
VRLRRTFRRESFGLRGALIWSDGSESKSHCWCDEIAAARDFCEGAGRLRVLRMAGHSQETPDIDMGR